MGLSQPKWEDNPRLSSSFLFVEEATFSIRSELERQGRAYRRLEPGLGSQPRSAAQQTAASRRRARARGLVLAWQLLRLSRGSQPVKHGWPLWGKGRGLVGDSPSAYIVSIGREHSSRWCCLAALFIDYKFPR